MRRTEILARDVPLEPDASKSIQVRQHDFQARLRHAEYAVGLLQGVDGATALQARIAELRRANNDLARDARYERERDAAAKAKRAASFPLGLGPTLGVPLAARPGAAWPAAAADADALASARASAFEWTLIAVVFAFVASYLRGFSDWTWRMAPEILCAACAAAWLANGPGLVLAAGIAAAILWRAVRLSALLRPAAEDGAHSGSGRPASPGSPASSGSPPAA
jgi:hypothetical protein